MKSAEAWASGVNSIVPFIQRIQADATSALQSDMKSMSDLLLEIEMHCPCGARPESPNTHPHVSGCPVAAAITLINTPHKSGILIPQHPPKDLVADLQSQVEQLRRQLKDARLPTLDHVQAIYKTGKLLTALEKCVVVLVTIEGPKGPGEFQEWIKLRDDALATAKPLLK